MSRYIGRSPDGLSLDEQHDLAGKWIALELYDPVTLPLREIAAVGDSAGECAAQLTGRGLDPSKFEYFPLKAPY